MDTLAQTPLHGQHVALGARMAPFGGWDMPIQYAGIVEEHHHTRRSAGLFDICHMGEFIVKGTHAAADLDKLVTSRVGALTPGRSRYGFLLNEKGGVLDDLIACRIGTEEFMLVVNAGTTPKDKEWIEPHLSPDTYFEDISAITAKLDLQGPLAGEVLQPHTETDLSLLHYFGFAKGVVCGCDALVSRTGYTGEYGFELFVSVKDVEYLWQKLLTDNRVMPVGLGARDTLRLEAGLPLYGHELGEDRTPASTPFSFAVDREKEFIGKEAMAAVRDRGPSDRLVGLVLAGRQSARHGQPVMREGKAVGVVTSGSFGPSVGYAVAFAYVEADCAGPGTRLGIDTGRKTLDATVGTLPFYTGGTARKK